MKKSILLTVAAMCAATAIANIFETNETQRANLKVLEAWDAEGPVTQANWSSRGIIAEQLARQVLVLAEACDVLEGATIEFPIVGELSDRDYESAFRTFAKPGDIAHCLEAMMGVPRGRNVNPQNMEYWAVGERVVIDVMPLSVTNTAKVKSDCLFGKAKESDFIPLKNYLIDKITGQAPAWDSFVYCGSPDDPETKGARLADTTAPNSVLSTYNERQTVLDTPMMSNQSSVYERFVLAGKTPFKPFGLYVIRFRPVKGANGKETKSNDSVVFASKDGAITATYANGKETASLPDLLKHFKQVSDSGILDQHVEISFNQELTVADAANIAIVLEKIEGDKGIKVGPPRKDEFYYKGFLPNQEWRDYKKRISQPWELHFATNAAPVRLVRTIEDWSDENSIDPKLTRKDFEVKAPAEAVDLITKGDAELAENMRLPVILIFAPAKANLSTFMPYVQALLPKHPLVYVFAE